MPAKSKAQQKFMGMVHASQKGEMKPKGAVSKAAKSIFIVFNLTLDIISKKTT